MGALTLAKLQEYIDYLGSDECCKRDNERFIARGRSIALVRNALRQNAITESECFALIASIYINGSLIVSPQMYERLRPLADGQNDVFVDAPIPT